MATTKKPATKRASAKKAPAKKTTRVKAKAAAVKRTPAKKRTSKANSASLRSFKVAQNQPAFTTFKITRQTVYWIILVAFIVFVQLWIIKLQVEVATLIETQQTEFLNNL